jgi:hypothetical protein
VLSACDVVLHREIAPLHGDPAVGGRFRIERVALQRVVRAQHDVVVARGEPIGVVGQFLIDQERARRRLLARVDRAMHDDEQAAPAVAECRAGLRDERLIAGRQLRGDRRRQRRRCLRLAVPRGEQRNEEGSMSRRGRRAHRAPHRSRLGNAVPGTGSNATGGAGVKPSKSYSCLAAANSGSSITAGGAGWRERQPA